MLNNNSRVKNSSRNIVFSLLAYMLQVVLGFIVRRYFIYFFNEEYLGLSSLFTNILNVLSLAELGFGTAIVFAMYKPIAENNEEEVRELLYFYKKCYRIIGIIIALVGLLLFPFLNIFVGQAPNIDVNIYVIYLLFLINSVSSYFFAHRRSLLYTNQRNDIEARINMVFNLLATLGQLLILFFAKNYYLYVALSGVIGILNNAVVFIITQKMFPQYVKAPTKALDKQTKKSIMKNIYALIFHRIGGVVVYSTDSIIIYLMLNAATLGKYSNYLMITTYITTMLNLIVNALRGSLGNSIVSESSEKNYNLLKKLNFIYMWIVSFSAVCIFALADPFIDIILTSSGAVLTLDKTVVLLVCVNFFLTASRSLVNTFKECVGMFYQDRFKPLIEGLINLVASIILTYFWGLPGVIVGTIISTISTSLWVEPFVLNKYYFHKSTWNYFLRYIIFVVAAIIAGIVTVISCNFVSCGGVLSLILKFIICAIVPNIVLLVCLCWTKEFKGCLQWGIQLIKKFLNKKTNKQNVILQIEEVNIKEESEQNLEESDN